MKLKKGKKIMSLFLAVIMALTVSGPAVVLAEDVSGDDTTDIKISVAGITAGSSYQDANVNPENLVNDLGLTLPQPLKMTEATYAMGGQKCWHTGADSKENAWLQVDLGSVKEIEKLYLWNLNQKSAKGVALPQRDTKAIEIYYSDTGEDESWIKLNDFVVPQTPGDAQPRTADLAIEFQAAARYVKIVAKSSYGDPNYWGLGKLVFTEKKTSESALIALLEAAIAESEATDSFIYSQATWDAYQKAANDAQELLWGGTELDSGTLQAAYDALQEAKKQLLVKTNLALGATVTASSYYQNNEEYNPARAVDGDYGTRWATNKEKASWIELDLQEVKEFNQVVVFEHPAYQGTLKNVIVQVSNNGEDWTLWREKGAWPPTTSIVGEKGSWRYLRIELECPNGKGNNIDEISLFCDESAVETEDPTQRPSVDPDWIKPKPSYLPSAAQKRQRNLKYGMFIHYGLSTFLDTEHSEKTHGTEMAESYRPSDKLDPESWVKAAYEAGMDYVLLVTKHTDGFVMWDSDYAEYGINHTGRDGEMDIVKAVSEACQKYGIKLALYYCLYDGHWEDNYTTESTGLDTQALYNKQNEVMINQLTELMDGRYGEIVELWMDAVWYKPDEAWELERIYDTVKKLQPSCQISVNHTMGKGKAPKNHKYGDPIHYFPSDFRLLDPHFTNPGPDADPKIFSHGDNMYYLPFEATITMNKAWFWKTNENASGTRTPEYVKEKYQHMVEQNNNLVINLGPNRDGLLAEYDVEALHNAARYMGFARGNARLTAADERKVEVRHETTDGKVAFTTQELYGKEGESYSTSPVENHAAMGYRLTVAPDNAKGAFGSTKTVVTYVYEDMLNSMRAIYFSGGESAEGDAPLQDETATGDTIILPENPFNKEGYTFIGWNDGSKTWRPGVAYTVPDHDVSFTAEWEVPGAVFELKVVNGSGSGQYRAGEEVTVTAEEAPAGKRFIGWKASREIEGADLTQNPCVFTMPEFAVELTAEYDEWVDVDTGKLEELLNTCKNLKTDDYTEASFSGMAAAIKDAEAVLEKGSVTQEDIDRVYHALKDIYDNLEKKAALFELKVTNGSGSGEYRAGDEVTVTADTAPEGKLFKGWTASQELGDVDLTQNPLVFTMPGANVELTAEYESMPEKVYAIDKEHQNQTYKKGQKEDLTFRVDAPMEEYIGTYINGVELQKGKDVEITEGSTIVKVKRRYLEKLDAGTYTITIRFKDAYAKTNFKVKGGSAVGPNAGEELNKTPDRNSSVKTGDKTDFALWIAVMGIAVIMIGIVLYRRCKKTSKK